MCVLPKEIKALLHNRVACSSTLPWCGAQSLIQAIHHTSPHNACPPNSRKQVYPLIFTPNDEVPRRPLRTIIDTVAVGTKGPTHVHVFLQDIRRTVVKVSINMRTREDTDDFPIPFQVSWMKRFLWCRITVALVITPRIYFPVLVEPPP
jgi:hypothetical protein